MFLRHSELLESPGEEQRNVLLSYCVVMIFPVGEGERVEFQPVLTPGLAVAVRNSCPTHDAFLLWVSIQAALALFVAPIAVFR